MADTVEVTLTNKAPGERSVFEDGKVVPIAPGETVTLDMDPAELKSAEKSGHFEFGKAKAPKPATKPAPKPAE